MTSTRARAATSSYGEPHAPPALALAALMLPVIRPALADLQVRMPGIANSNSSNRLITFDNKDSSLNRAQSYNNSIGCGVLPW